MKSEKVMNEILYGDTVYVSALPVLVIASISDVFDKFIEYFVTHFLIRQDRRE